MAWPTTSDVKSEFAKLNHSALDTKIGRAITRAQNLINSKLAQCYDISGWASSTPPLLFDVCLSLAYGYTANLVHAEGARLSGSDEAALGAWKWGNEVLGDLMTGKQELLNSSGSIISRTCRPGRVAVLRTEKQMMSADPYESSYIDAVDRTDSTERFT